MIEKDATILKQYTGPLSRSIQDEYAISPEHYRGDVKLGLRNSDGTGVLVGVSRVGSVQGYLLQDGQRVPIPGQLYYRGIELTDIVEAHRRAGTFGFEEVAYLLLMGYLPSKSELVYFDKIMNQARKLPEGFTEGMIMRHPSRSIMNELARSVLSLYSYDPDPDNTSIDNMLLQSVKLIGYFPSIVANAYAMQRHYFHGDSLHIHYPVPELSTAENFLRMMRPDKSYTDEEAHLLDMMLMVHAEHGGANAKVMEMFHYIKENVDPHDDGSIKDYLCKLLDGAAGDRSGKLYGLGHAVYTISDPRAVLLKKYAQHMAEIKGYAEDFALLQKVETLGIPLIQERRGSDTPMCANVDMYSGLVYTMLGIPEEVFTPLFASARIAGWCANRIEEVVTCHRIMRPAYRAVTTHEKYIPMEERATHLRLAGVE